MRNPIVVNGNNVKRFVNLVDKLPEHLRQDYTSTQVLDTFAMYLNDAYREDFARNQYELKKVAFNESDVFKLTQEFEQLREKLLYANSTNTDVIFVQDSSINNFSVFAKYIDTSINITSSTTFEVENVDNDFLQIGYYVSGGYARAFNGGFSRIVRITAISSKKFEIQVDEPFDSNFQSNLSLWNYIRIGNELSVTSDVYAFNVSNVTDVKVRRIIGDASYAEIKLTFSIYNVRNNISDVDYRYEPRDNFLKSVIQSSNFLFDALPKNDDSIAKIGQNFVFGDLNDKIVELDSDDYSDSYAIDNESRYNLERYNNFNFTVEGSLLVIEMPLLTYENQALKVVSNNNAILSSIIKGTKVVYEGNVYIVDEFDKVDKVISFEGYDSIQINNTNSNLLIDIIDIFSQDLAYIVGENKVTISRTSYKSNDGLEYFSINANCSKLCLSVSSVLTTQINVGQPLYGVTKYTVSNINYTKSPESINNEFSGDIFVEAGIISTPIFNIFPWKFDKYDIFIVKVDNTLIGKQFIGKFILGKSTDVLQFNSINNVFQYLDNNWEYVDRVKKTIWLEDSNLLNRNYTIYGWQSPSYEDITLKLELTVNCIASSIENSYVYINAIPVIPFKSNGKQFHNQVVIQCEDTFEENIPLSFTVESISESNVNPLISKGALLYFRNNYSDGFDNAYRYINRDSYRYLAIPQKYDVGTVVFDGDSFYELVRPQSSQNDLPPTSLNWRLISSRINTSSETPNPDIFVLNNLSQNVGYIDNLNLLCRKYDLVDNIYAVNGNMLTILNKYQWAYNTSVYDSANIAIVEIKYIASLDLTTFKLLIQGTSSYVNASDDFYIYPSNLQYSTSISNVMSAKISKNIQEKDWVLSPIALEVNQNNRSGYIQFIDQDDVSIDEWKSLDTVDFYSRYDLFNQSTEGFKTFDGSDIVDAYYKYIILEMSDVTKTSNSRVSFKYNMPHLNSLVIDGNYSWLYVGLVCEIDSIDYSITKIDNVGNSYVIYFDKDIISTNELIKINVIEGTNKFSYASEISSSKMIYSPSIDMMPFNVINSEFNVDDNVYEHYTSHTFAKSGEFYSYVFNKVIELNLPPISSFKVKSVYIECVQNPETLQYGINTFEEDAIPYTLAQVGSGLILNPIGSQRNVVDYNFRLPYLKEYDADFVTIPTYDSRYDLDTSVEAIPGIKPKYGTLLDKINGLTSMHDVNSIDFNVIQYLARYMGYDLAISLPTEVHPSKSPEKLLRSVISRLPEFASLRSTSNGIESIIASFGIVTKLITLWTNKNNPYESQWVSKDDIIAELKYDELSKSYIPTPHFKITVEQNSTGVYGKEFDELMAQIKVTIRKNMPVNTVFDGLIAQVKVVTRLFMKQGFVNVKQVVKVNPRPVDYKVDISDYTDCNCDC